MKSSPTWRYAIALGCVVIILGKGGRRIPRAFQLAAELAKASPTDLADL